MSESSEHRRIKTLSLFSGAGGLDIGFHQAGFDIVAAVEIEPAYAATLAANSGAGEFFGPELAVHCEDIRTFDPTPYAATGVECIIGGPPCQTFSAAGRRSGGVLGTDDERGQLFLAYVHILRVLKPKVFVFENVYGLPGANGGEPWREIVRAFKDAGYNLHAEVLDAADYGVPQHRERLIMVGYRRGDFEFPAPTHGPDSESGQPLISAMAALNGLPEKPAGPPLGGMYGHLLPMVPPGLNYAFFTQEMGHPAPQFAWRSKFHDFLHKADPAHPVRTIKSKPGKFTGPFHWDNRHFTTDELKRLQSFPDEYDVVGSDNKVLEQIGNSVPPRLAYCIAVSVREQLLENRQTLSLPRRAPGFKSTFRNRQRTRTAHFKEVAARAIAAGYGAEGWAAASPIEKDQYFATFTSWFDRKFSPKRPNGEYDLAYKVTTSRSGEALALSLRSEDRVESALSVTVSLSGLSKYMEHTDTVVATAQLNDVGDLLPVWAVIEYELVRQSRFFTLVDIYGHYANRGDTVEVHTTLTGVDSPVVRAINFFGDSRHCGIPMTFSAAQDAIAIEGAQLSRHVHELRALRWDLRTKGTHPTLRAGSVLCTYPFPNISAKAHFDKGPLEPRMQSELAG